MKLSSFLLPLPVQGHGTSEIESFSSYFARLAFHHGIGRCQLRRLLLSRFGAPGSKIDVSETLLYGRGLLMQGLGGRNRELVEITRQATKNDDVPRTTLLTLAGALSSSAGIRRARHWCDECFRDDEAQSSNPYDRLLWILTPVERCHLHRAKLSSSCPACGRAQRYHSASGGPLACAYCGSSLLGEPGTMTPAIHGNFEEHHCIGLVGAISSGQLDTVVPKAQRIFEQHLSKQITAIAQAGSLGETRWGRLRKNRTGSCTVLTLLKIADATGTQVADILTDPVNASLSAGRLVFDELDIPIRLRASHARRVEMALQRIAELLDDPNAVLPSLIEVGAQFGVARQHLGRRSRDLVKRYTLRKMAQMMERHRRTKAAARVELMRMKEAGAMVSRHGDQIVVHLMETTGCIRRDAKTVLRESCGEIFD